jgi:PAS domain S-box-containing protein
MDQGFQKTILLVEDEALIAVAQRSSLEKYGYKVLTAHSGEKAVDLCGTMAEIDLILMDIDLGKGMNGPQSAKAIIKNRNIPVVFLSSHTEPEIVELTEKITSYGYVVKNSGITVLDASIKMAFKLSEANRALELERNQLRVTLHSISDAVISTDSNGRITRMNPNAEAFTGWDYQDVEGKSVQEVFPFLMTQSATPIEDGDGNIVGGLHVFKDNIPRKDGAKNET